MTVARHRSPFSARSTTVVALFVALFVAAVDAPAATNLTPARVQSIAAGAKGIDEVTRAHPDARWTTRLREASGVWLAYLADSTGRRLATVTVADRSGKITRTTIPTRSRQRLLEARAAEIADRDANARDWVARYRTAGRRVTMSTSYADFARKWERHYWVDGKEVARVMVSDDTGRVTESWTGPQVLWSMARGGGRVFGGKVNDPLILFGFTVTFALCFLDWKRLRSIRTLDVAALLAFTGSLWYFNHGDVFASALVTYIPFTYLVVRMLLIGFGRTPVPAFSTRLPTWLMLAVAIFAMGFRGGLNYWGSSVIDVGYAGVAGAGRLIDGRIPYAAMPKKTSKPCGTRYSNGEYSAYEQANGRCESPVENGDTYGPVNYYAYVPATAALGWSGRFDDLPAAHVTSVAADLIAALLLGFAGYRIGGRRVGAAALLFWATFPFTVYSMSANANDAIAAAFVAGALAFLSSPFVRGVLLGLGAWAKFAPALLLPLLVRADRDPTLEPADWPFEQRRPPLLPRVTRWRRLRTALSLGRPGVGTVAGFLAATALAFAPLVALDGPGVFRTFWSRTFGWQLDRPSPFSVWDWGEYPGMPDLAGLQIALKLLLIALAALLFVAPRRLDAARVAALGAVLLVGFQLVLTHWMHTYVPWWVPCVAIALLAPRRAVSVQVPVAARAPAEPASLASARGAPIPSI